VPGNSKFDASVQFRIPLKQRRAVRRLAKALQLKEADIIRAALRLYLEQHGENKSKSPGLQPELV
jgi:hypothetical protein